jgi:poly(A) polymerase/tRNA nucleotidyltransferase (CCA-adding enzyme)
LTETPPVLYIGAMNAKAGIDLSRELFGWERALIAECDLYLVGGIVRDLLLGTLRTDEDVDYLASGIEYDRLAGLLVKHGKANYVGKSFGVIKFTPPDGTTVDISLPRTEFSTGRGHRDFEVTYDPSLPVEEDLVRRDFTFNSMACRLADMELVDPLGGLGDLHDRVLRVNQEDSFRDDPLRILRGVQLLARFHCTAHEDTLRQIEQHRGLLPSVSAERVRDELNKLMLLAERPGDGFIFMHEAKILDLVLPELEETYGIEQNEYHPDDLFTHSIKSCNAAKPDLVVRWSALLHDLGKVETKQEKDGRIVFYRHEEDSARKAKNILGRLKFSNEFTRLVVHLIDRHMFQVTEEWSDGAIRRFVARVGVENLEDLYELREADARSRSDEEILENLMYTKQRVEKILEAETALKRDDLAIDGSDVMEILGIEAGPEIGTVLQKLLDMVLEHPELNTRDKLTEFVKEMKG